MGVGCDDRLCGEDTVGGEDMVGCYDSWGW